MNNNSHSNSNGAFPLSQKRRNSKTIDVVPISDQNITVIPHQDNAAWKQEAALKVLDSMPALLNLASSLIEIRNTAVQADAAVKLIREQGEFLQKQADAFVQSELARSQSFTAKSEAVQRILKGLYEACQTLQMDDQTKREYIKVVDGAIQRLFADQENRYE